MQTIEKIPRGIELTATRHLRPRLGAAQGATRSCIWPAAVAAVGRWRAPIRLNETTRAYFTRLAAISAPEDAARYRERARARIPEAARPPTTTCPEREPRHASMLRTSVSPTIIAGGYRINVIPSEAKATLDVRMLPDEDPATFLEAVRQVVNDPAVDGQLHRHNGRAGRAASARLDSEAFSAIEAAVTRTTTR